MGFGFGAQQKSPEVLARLEASKIRTIAGDFENVGVPFGAHVIELAAGHEGLNGVGGAEQDTHAALLDEVGPAPTGEGGKVMAEAFEPECVQRCSCLFRRYEADHAQVDSELTRVAFGLPQGTGADFYCVPIGGGDVLFDDE